LSLLIRLIDRSRLALEVALTTMKKDILALTFAVVTVGAHADRAMAYTMVITHMRRFVRVDPDLSVTSMVKEFAIGRGKAGLVIGPWSSKSR